MPRKKIEVQSAMTSAGAGLVGKLAEELKSGSRIRPTRGL